MCDFGAGETITKKAEVRNTDKSLHSNEAFKETSSSAPGKAAFPGAGGGVPRCRTPCSPVPGNSVPRRGPARGNMREQEKKVNLYKSLLDHQVLAGLEEYFDTRRTPHGYASYIHSAAPSDRFYDDNVWLGIDFTDIYRMTKEEKYLEKALLIWNFIESGMDDKLGGGIYWCEQKKESKNTCSNAPGSVLALKLFEATKDSAYLVKGQYLYEWTQVNLQDSTDYLYFDHLTLDGNIGKAKFAYNSGQMMQSAALLYRFTGEKAYLTDAQNIARGCYNYFFADYTPEHGETFSLLKKGDVWFSAVMLRGFIELYRIDGNATYLDSFKKSLDYAWDYARDEKGLFSTDFSGKTCDNRKWLLTQAALVEMYARLATIE